MKTIEYYRKKQRRDQVMKRPPIFIDYLKTAIPSKAINRLNTIPIEISMSLSIEIKKINPKIDMETKKNP
jgi:hypothetical protein